MQQFQSAMTQLECPECSRLFDANTVQTFCPDCSGPLFAVYDLSAAKLTLTHASLSQRPVGIWRWTEILPVRAPAFRLTLGEAGTPLLKADSLGARLGLNSLYIKDEAHGPLGSLHARGMLISVARGLELGTRDFVLAAAGSDGAALAAYAARARAHAHIYMPRDASLPDQIALKTLGADLVLVDGHISDAAQLADEAAHLHGWLDVSPFREPYRCEGTKSIGLELAEAFDWELPDVIVVPTGSGLGLMGIWKAFAELEQMGFIGSYRPRMVVVQSLGCAPLVRAFEQKDLRAQFWHPVHTGATGLRVPEVFADRPLLRALRASNGVAVAVSDEDILNSQREMAVYEGIFAAPEGAASLAAARQLIAAGEIGGQERVVLVNSGSGLNYL